MEAQAADSDPDHSINVNVTTNADWLIRASKKGDILVSTEKRPLSKEVTLVKHVEKNANSLLKALRKKFGTGGTTYGSTVEIQGPLVEKVREYLLLHAECLIGIRKDLLPAKKEFVLESSAVVDGDKKERRKPRHKRKELGKATSVDNQSSYGSIKCINSKTRCAHDWPYCSGWCYEPDSEPEEDDSLDYSQFDTPWLLNDELLDSADSKVNLCVPMKSMTPQEINVSLRLLGLAATSCSCNDGSVGKLKISQKREKIMKRQMERSVQSAQPFQSLPVPARSAIKPMFHPNHPKKVKSKSVSNTGVVSYATKVQGMGNQREDDYVDYENCYEERDSDDSYEEEESYPAPTFEFSFEDHVKSLGLRQYESNDSRADNPPSYSIQHEVMSKKQLDQFPPIKSKKKKGAPLSQPPDTSSLALREEAALAQALRESMQASVIQTNMQTSEALSEEEMMRKAIQESLQIQEELYTQDDDFDQDDFEDLNEHLDGSVMVDDRIEARMQSTSFVDALALLEIMGFPNNERTRAALLQAEGDDVWYAIEMLTRNANDEIDNENHPDVEPHRSNKPGHELNAAADETYQASETPQSISDWLVESLSKNGVEDSVMYTEYIISYLNELQEEYSDKNKLDLNDRIFEWSSSLSTLLSEIFPDMSPASVQSLSFEATSIFINS